MMNSSDDSAKHLRPMQFSLRWILIAMAVAALAFAAVGPSFRHFSAPLIGLAMAAWSCGVVFWWGLMMINRAALKREHAKAGTTFLIAARRHLWRRTLPVYLLGCLGLISSGVVTFAFLNLASQYYLVRNPFGLGGVATSLAWPERILLIVAAMGAAGTLLAFTIDLGRQVHFGKHGFVDRLRFTPWSDVGCDDFRQRRDDVRLELRSASGKEMLVLSIHAADRPAVEEALRRVRPLYNGDKGREFGTSSRLANEST